jgi:tetratricopeptide (TPR) repeat protein
MTDDALDRFRSFLASRNAGHGVRDVLLHEMGATINRHRLTGREEGMQSFNTTQLCELVVSQRTWTREQAFVTGLMLSALIDGESDIFDAAMAEGIVPPAWTWVSWARGFTGNEADLRRRLKAIAAVRERSGAVCLAVRTAPNAIGSALLSDFCLPTFATVYHHLLRVGLTTSNSTAIADSELPRLAQQLEVLFAEDTDLTLATLVRASSYDHPDVITAPFKDAAGDLTRTAIAQRHLEKGRPSEALALVQNLRLLSPAYDQAILIAALAALECGKRDKAEFFARNISDDDTRLKIVTRIAQASGDQAGELDALTRLYERNPTDTDVFIMLTNALLRLGQSALAYALASEAQERFGDDPLVARVIKPILQRGPGG